MKKVIRIICVLLLIITVYSTKDVIAKELTKDISNEITEFTKHTEEEIQGETIFMQDTIYQQGEEQKVNISYHNFEEDKYSTVEELKSKEELNYTKVKLKE